MNQTRRDPFARLALVGTLLLALYVTFGGQSPAAPAQAQEIIYLPTPTMGVPAPAPVLVQQSVDPVVVEVPAPVVEAPPVEAPAVAVTNEGSRPVEHPLSAAPQPITIDPQPAEPKNGDVLIQAHDGPSFAAVINGEGTKPSRAWKP